MKVFIPGKQNANPFFENIKMFSKHDFIYRHYSQFDSSIYNLILIQWPEQIFRWFEPDAKQLDQLRKSIEKWKRETKIFYVVHNLKPHVRGSERSQQLYELVEENCDVMIHLGNHSLELFKKKYPEKTHKVVFHPLFNYSYRQHDKSFSRRALGIDPKAVVIIVPGQIRSFQEQKIVLNAFNSLRLKNKILIITRIKRKTIKDFRGRYFLRPFIDIKKIFEKLSYFRYKRKEYLFSSSYVPKEEFSLMLSASDVVFVPRIESLNSGMVFLGLTFSKTVVGPDIGNISEVLKMFDYPLFDPSDNKSVERALNKAIKSDMKFDKQFREKLMVFEPREIAIEWDELLKEQSGASNSASSK